jgi:hypothetical protein
MRALPLGTAGALHLAQLWPESTCTHSCGWVALRCAGMVLYVILSVMASGWTMSKTLGCSYFFMYGVFITQKLIRVLA